MKTADEILLKQIKLQSWDKSALKYEFTREVVLPAMEEYKNQALTSQLPPSLPSREELVRELMDAWTTYPHEIGPEFFVAQADAILKLLSPSHAERQQTKGQGKEEGTCEECGAFIWPASAKLCSECISKPTL